MRAERFVGGERGGSAGEARRLALAVALLVGAGCDAETLPDAGADAGPPPLDAGELLDAGEPDAGADAGAPIDAGPPDAGAPGCFAGDVRVLATGELLEMAASISRGQVVVAWTERREGSVDVYARSEGESGFRPEVALGETLAPRSLAGLGDDEGHWLAWTATDDGVDDYDLRLRRLDRDAAPTAATQILEADDGVGDHLPTLAGRFGEAHLLWVRRNLFGGGAPILARRALGEPLGERVELAGDAAPGTRIRGHRLEDGLVWAWLDARAEGTFVHARVDGLAASTGSAIPLSSDGRAAGGLDVAGELGEAAVAWDVYVGESLRREVRLRLLTSEGAYESAELPLTRGASGGHTPSIVAFAGGYLGLWHGFGGPEGDHVHLAYIDPLGVEAGGLALAPLTGEVTATELLVDGRSVVAVWLEQRATDARLRLMRVLCNF